MKTLIFALWSLFIWPFALLWMAAIVAVSIPLTWFIPFSRLQAHYPAIMMGWLPYISWSRVTTIYDPKFDHERRSVFIQNHVSMFDGHIALKTIPGRFCGVENAAHYKVPFYGWLMKHGGSIPIYPGQKGQSERLICEAQDRIERGYSILLFPEGHRTRDGKVGPFRRGAFLMALRNGAPVVPLAVRGLHEVFPKGSWILRPGHIEIYVGPQIETAGLGDSDLDALMQRVHDSLSHWVATGTVPASAPVGSEVESEPEPEAGPEAAAQIA